MSESKKNNGKKAGKVSNSTKKKIKSNNSRSVPINNDIQNFPVVGIGASAGGLESFEKFFTNMPADSGAAFILVPHLDPTKISILPDLIRKYTEMKVITIKDGIKISPNNIYIVPPDNELGIVNGILHLIKPTNSHFRRLPIDFFFRELAKDQGKNATSIIFSGAGSDGAVGLKDIKGEMGMVMVQEPTSAKYDSMPKSAISTGLVDFILPPEGMPKTLLNYIKHNYKI